jgi:hypothetical protein
MRATHFVENQKGQGADFDNFGGFKSGIMLIKWQILVPLSHFILPTILLADVDNCGGL